MYTPAAFRVDDLATLHALILDHNFGTVYGTHDGVIRALEKSADPMRRRVARLMRASIRGPAPD